MLLTGALTPATEALIGIWLVCGLLGAVIGSGKGRAGSGLVLGLLLGVIGLIIVALMSPNPEAEARRQSQIALAAQNLPGMRRCPWCAQSIQSEALICQYCGRDVVRLPAPNGDAVAEGWLPDPSGRYATRYWDGNEWTKWVGTADGTEAEDPPVRSLDVQGAQ